jgi:hypothetical protein
VQLTTVPNDLRRKKSAASVSMQGSHLFTMAYEMYSIRF